MSEMPAKGALVDDDPAVRQAFARLLKTAGHSIETFLCAQELLAYPGLADFSCILLDVCLPDLNGLDLQAALEDLEYAPPIVFITGQGDIPMTVRAIQAGAIDFLTKPCEADRILDAVERASRMDAEQRQRLRSRAAEQAQLARLTPREREVLARIVDGLRNKQIAARLGICEKTVKVHRGHIMEKMNVNSVAELVCIYQRVGATQSLP